MSDGESGRRVVDGRFELEARLGGGGMGMVWRARDLVLDRAVALKEVRPPDPSLAEYDPHGAAMLRAGYCARHGHSPASTTPTW